MIKKDLEFLNLFLFVSKLLITIFCRVAVCEVRP